MHEHQLDVVVTHVHKTTQMSRVCKRESFSSEMLGCAAAYGPSAVPQHSAFNAGDNANTPRTTRDAEHYGYPAISSDQVTTSPPLRPNVEDDFLASMLARAASAELYAQLRLMRMEFEWSGQCRQLDICGVSLLCSGK